MFAPMRMVSSWLWHLFKGRTMTNSRILLLLVHKSSLTTLPVSSLDEAYIQAFLAQYGVQGMGGL